MEGKKSLDKKTALLLLALAVLANTVLMKYNIDGLLRELTRLSVLVSFAVFLFCLFRKKSS